MLVTIRRALPLVLTLLAVLLPQQALAWGNTGHRVIGALAEPYLTARARAAVRRILGTETMAEAATWSDFMRGDPAEYWQKTASAWHFVTVPKGRTYAEVGAPPEGDAVTALKRFSATIRDPRATAADKRDALRFIIHIVGDLQQPLHVHTGEDDGAWTVKLTFLGQPTNLHLVWDQGLIDNEQLSYTEMAAFLRPRITPALAAQWGSPDPLVWIAEGAAIRERIYPATDKIAFGSEYIYRNQTLTEERLERGGVRLAAYLNALFAGR